MNHVHDGSFHSGCLQVAVSPAVNVSQRLAQILSVFDVDGDELEDTVLSKDTDYHGALCLIVNVYKRDATSARLEHTTTCSVQGLERMYRDGLDGLYANGFFDVTETVEAELVDLC